MPPDPASPPPPVPASPRLPLSASLSSYALRLHPSDPLAIARQDLAPGLELLLPDGAASRHQNAAECRSLVVREAIPAGHKLALTDLPEGALLTRYGYPIGRATAAIQAGSWVHSHNLALGEIAGEYSYRVVAPLQPAPGDLTFLGYPRPGGRAGTRNYIAVISTVSCSAHVASQIARAFPPERLADYPNVDGVVPIVHGSGCSLPPGGRSHTYLKRALGNLGHHPNIGAALYVGLGCEVNQLDGVESECRCLPLYAEGEMERLAPDGLVIQDLGGFRRTVEAGIERVAQLLSQVNAVRRAPQPLSNLAVALQCGGSDGWSGVTANPLVGRVVDRLAGEGATAVLAETPEIFGAESLLLERLTSEDAARRLIAFFNRWLEEARRRGFSIDNNPSPGNKLGGLTTIYEKSLGAAAKGGRTPLNGAYDYAERIDRPGLVFMDTPGNDPISVSGQIAGGCNLILFTTGRGSVYGSALAPCLKIATHSRLYARMPDDMDFNAGMLLEGASWESAAGQLLELLVATASGQRTKSEAHGLSENEFVPWQPDAFL